MTNRNFLLLIIYALLSLTLLMSGCSNETSASQAAKTPPPPMVATSIVAKKDIPLTREYVGQTAGSREVQVRARTGGILLERTYIEGSWVEEGDVLFKIDPKPAQAAFDQEKGDLAKLEAKLQNAKLERNRIASLRDAKVVSEQEYDDAVAAFESALASVEAAKARVREAKINLSYTEVTAPISGITSKETRSEGSLITLDESGSLLTTITVLNPLYVNFSVPGTEALSMRRMMDNGSARLAEEGYTLQLQLTDNTRLGETGKINFADKMVDPKTGTIRMRGQFENKNGLLLPGEFVRVIIEGAILNKAITVPQSAVLFTSNTPLVYVLDKDNVASPRPVKLGETVGSDFIIKEGLQGGERIVSQGIIKVRPGSAVNPVSAKAAAQGDA
ncbi:efflux RND transporter periplasmic adaptor subunit [Halodesulfovibrio marinisediminis]|uniref:Membrane fusion protein, multidrug efflux system n=1 Tax=Halodesulfovibrio marinisediminis DSM 17456 TaxID=1121457 RepID=A0A1N6HD19_9BACT|nr:efflux RND transporter periplasmic adaptor subunit [Halodesulfovibrio marinisediminis]SIO17738.1 membrane fusion protein, multidrug efflux system [Halodesulfovibrio marinisediminis DSM 17456]